LDDRPEARNDHAADIRGVLFAICLRTVRDRAAFVRVLGSERAGKGCSPRKSKERPMSTYEPDPERERPEPEPEPEQPGTMPGEEPGPTPPEPDTLPEEPDVTPPDLERERI